MSAQTPDHPSRRQVLSAGAAATVAGSLCGCAALFGSSTGPDLTVSAVEGTFRVQLAAVPAAEDAKAYLVVALTGQPEKVMVFRHGEGLAALGMTCTHRGCDVGYDGGRGVVVCPCHGSEYDVQGGNLEGPADEPLTRWQARVEGDQVVVSGAA